MDTLNTHDTLRVLGKMAQIIYKQQGQELPKTVEMTVLARPLTGLGLMQRDVPCQLTDEQQQALAECMDQLPAEISNGPVSVQAQGGFWLGWYKDAAGAQAVERLSPVHFEVPADKKALYVKAAQREGKKLVPWVIEQLDAAAQRGE